MSLMQANLDVELALQKQAEFEAKAQSHAAAAARTKLQILREKVKSNEGSLRSRSTIRHETSPTSPVVNNITGREFLTPTSRRSPAGSVVSPVPVLPILEKKPVHSTPSTNAGSQASQLNADTLHRNEMMIRQKEFELETRMRAEASKRNAEFELQREKRNMSTKREFLK